MKKMKFKDFREDLTNFPISCRSGGVWYILINLSESSITYYTSSKTNKGLILEKLETDSNCFCIGFWKGEWRTDGFIITKEFFKKNSGDF